MWYVFYAAFEGFFLMVENYTIPGVPEHSFDVFGPGVLLSVFFPLLWVFIFAFCREIASKNKEIAELIAMDKKRAEGGKA